MKRQAGRGTTIRRGEPGFDAAVLATSFSAEDPPRRPDILVQANDVEDVIAAVALANSEGHKVAACSGGHSWSQNHIRQGGLLLDLSRLDDLVIDAANGSATAGPGCLSGELDKAFGRHGLFFPVAHAYTVALGGFLLTGGFGWNSRVMGLACESVTAVDVVLADGSLVHASESENADLLWAVRGSGPGFPGIVVRFHLRLHRRPRYIGLKLQVFRVRHLEEVYAWADRVGPEVSPQVEFQVVMNRKSPGIFSQGIEVLAPVLTDSRPEAREAVRFIDRSPIRKLASFTLPLIPISPGLIMKGAEKVVFLANTRWQTDNMWIRSPITSILPQLRAMADTQPAPPAHALWMNWNPVRGSRPDMAFSVESSSYLAVYGGILGATKRAADETWAIDHVRAMEHQSAGIQLGDENLARRSAPFMRPENAARLAVVVARFDPERRFWSYGDAS